MHVGVMKVLCFFKILPVRRVNTSEFVGRIPVGVLHVFNLMARFPVYVLLAGFLLAY